MRKKRAEKRRPTAEEMSRAADVKLRRYATKSAIEWATRDPEVKRQMIAQTFGYKIPDEAEKSEVKLSAHIDELAIKRLKEDPDFARRITEARLLQIAERMGLQIEGEEWRRKPPSLDDITERAKKYKELKELFAPKPWDAFINKEVITEILSIINGIIVNKQPAAGNRVLVLVQENGEEKLITEEEYRERKAQARSKSPANLELTASNSRPEGSAVTSESETLNRAIGRDEETGAAGSVSDAALPPGLNS